MNKYIYILSYILLQLSHVDVINIHVGKHRLFGKELWVS